MPAPRIMLMTALVATLSVASDASDVLRHLAPAGALADDAAARLAAGAAVIDVLPHKGRDLGVFAATRTSASPDRLAAWGHQADALLRSRYMPDIVRFSREPRLADVAALSLDDTDLEDLRVCRAGSCAVKLAAPEMDRIRAATAGAGVNWKDAAQDAFRAVVVDRARAYLADATRVTPPYYDRRTPLWLDAEFTGILGTCAFATLLGPVADHLRLFPRSPYGVADSYLYWSREKFGSAKPIIAITHVIVVRSTDPWRPETLIAMRQIFATHYVTSGLSVIALTHTPGQPDGYLLYAYQSRMDVLEGLFAGVRRRMIEGRVRAEAPKALHTLRLRIEQSDPPLP